jgi:O-antigen ligase
MGRVLDQVSSTVLIDKLLSLNLSPGQVIAVAVVQLLLALVLFFCTLVQSLIFLSLALVALVFFIRPQWAAYVLVLLVPLLANYVGFYYEPTGIGTLSSKPIPVFAPVLIFAFTGLLFRKAARLPVGVVPVSSWTVPMLLITIYAYASLLLWAPYYEYGAVTLLIIVVNFVLYYYFVAVTSESIHRRLMTCWVMAGVITSVMAILSFYQIPAQLFYSRDITESVVFTYINFTRFLFRGHALGHPNVAALVLNLTICVNVGLLLTEKSRTKAVFLWVSMALLIFGNFLTLSKAGLGSFMVMTVFLIFVLARLRERFFINMTKVMLGVALVFSLSFIYYQNAISKDRPFRLLSLSTRSGGEVTSLRHRIEMWKAGYAQMERRKLLTLGLGPGGFEKTTRYPHAHNMYFSLFFDLGVPGVMFGIFILISLGRHIWHAIGKYFRRQTSYLEVMSLCLIGGLLSLAMQSTVDEYYYKHVAWIFLALAMSTFALARGESRERKEL